MFILIPIAINSSLTSKRAHMCILIAIAGSLIVSRDSSRFSSDCSNRVSKRQREKGFKPSFHCLHTKSISPSRDIILKIPTVKKCGNKSLTTYQNFMTIQRLKSLGSQFYGDNFGFLREKKKLQCKGYFSQFGHFFIIPNGENVRK